MIPVLAVAAAQKPAREVTLMKSLHDDDDWRVRAVLPALHGRAEPVDHVLAHDGAVCFAGLVWVVNNDCALKPTGQPACAAPGYRTLRTCRVNNAALLGAKLVFCGAVISNLSPRKYLLINLVAHYFTNAVSVICCKPLRVAGVNPFAVRVYTCRPSDKVHHGQFCFAGPGRNVDNQTPCLAQHHFL